MGENIVREREKQGLRQVDLAAKLDMEPSSLRRIEKGTTNTTLGMLHRIAEALDVEVREFI